MTIDEAIQDKFEHENDMKNNDLDSEVEGLTKEADPAVDKSEPDYKDMYIRLCADFDNYKKRAVRDRASVIELASKDLVLKFLDVVDNFERALGIYSGNKLEDTQFTKGMKMTYDSFIKTLESAGCVKIPTSWGDKFDPEIHDALTTRPIADSEGYDPDDVVDIVQSGWKLNGHIIRHVKVVIGK